MHTRDPATSKERSLHGTLPYVQTIELPTSPARESGGCDRDLATPQPQNLTDSNFGEGQAHMPNVWDAAQGSPRLHPCCMALGSQ
jgi:hypothetical protein